METRASRSYRIGKIEVTPLWDGPLASSLEKIPDPAHRREAEQLIAQAPAGAMTMDVFGYLLKIDGGFALIDTGAGCQMSADLGKLVDSLRAHGVTPEQIGHIFLTHLHRDHFGGLVDARGHAAFPNAQLIVHEREAAFWLDTELEDMIERARRYRDLARALTAPYANRIRRLKSDEGFLGVTARPAPGHTPGHTCWHVQSGGQSILAWGDLIHIAWLHLPSPHIAMEYDLDPATALQSRRRVLDWVSNERILVAGAHLPSPGVGTIVREGNGYAFEPEI